MLDLNNTPHWYALYTKARTEKKVDVTLQEKGFESYLPLQKTVRQWHDRKKKVDLPVFSSYVFVRMALRERIPVLQTDGVVKLVSFTGTPAPIPDFEIAAVKRILEGQIPYEVTNFLRIGQDVEVITGPLKGLHGRIIENRRRNRLLVGIQQIGQALSVEVLDSQVRLLKKQ